MNASEAKAPEFDPGWWKTKKAKEADLGNKITAALTKYQAALKVFNAQTKISGIPHLDDVENALVETKKAAVAEKANKSLGIFQKDTLTALDNYAKAADAAIAHIKRVENSPIMTSAATVLVKQVPQFQEYCKKNFQAESFNYLSLMYKNPKKEKKWYDAFIKRGAQFEINIPSAQLKAFDAIAKDVTAGTKPDTPETWVAAPWKESVIAIEKLLDTDVVRRFRAFMSGVLLDGKLP